MFYHVRLVKVGKGKVKRFKKVRMDDLAKHLYNMGNHTYL